MKKLTYSLIIAVIAIGISSCGKDVIKNTSSTNPEACFTIENNGSLEIGSNLRILNCSKNSESYEWKINNAFVDIDNYKFDSSGTYNIQLTAINIDGSKSNSITKTITVNNQFLTYSGTWNITERERGGSYVFNYISNVTFDKLGNVIFSKFTDFEVQVQLTNDINDSKHYIIQYIVDITDDYRINCEINFTTNGSQKQFTGVIQYFEGSNFLGSYDVSGVKQ